MAVTKILARHAPVKALIDYALNGDKTDDRVLTASQNCTTEHASTRMSKTKKQYHQEDGVQCYHIIQSFQPGEVTPELALEIAQEFAKEYLSEYEVVIGTHVDRHHVHNHIVFNSVSTETGKKYHSTPQSYYQQMRAVSDRLCREHGLSVIMESGEKSSKSYIEWLRESKGQPTFRSMLEADLRDTTATGWVFGSGDRSGSCTPAGEIRCSQKLGSRRQLKEIWQRSTQDASLLRCIVPGTAHPGKRKSIRALWCCIITMSICWDWYRNGSIRPE